MNQDCYERLANALDALPNGFPRMPSGIEIRLLRKAFSEEEAEVTGHMSRTYETAREIANRAGLTEDRVSEVWAGLLPRKLVRQARDGTETFRLGPFIIGWYESLMGDVMRTDVEFVELFEQYLKEGGGEKIMAPRPGILGVVPVRGSLKPSLLQPHHDIDAHFARHERFAVIDCVCRIERNLVGGGCSRLVKRCAFVGVPAHTPLSEDVLDRDQALKVFAQLEDEGHVHLGFYGFISTAESPQFVGSCNCCGDCCGILRALTDLGLSEGPQKSNYRAAIDLDDCTSCGTCIERCQVQAIAVDADDMPILNRDRCIGCGLCVTTCPSEAIKLEPVSAAEWFDIPSSFEEWEEMRLRAPRQE